ncbi:MAG: ABC transporter ATP-binding protein, partial [Gluconobacter cerinus]|uniref:ATP-binding cassette domain-containing protein n=1 Tax=Gluconobacter cerinus TaxID=38307 RepID=UPI0039ED5B10
SYIALGRRPLRGPPTAQQYTAALQTAIQYFRVEPFLKRPIGSLSGGERQRVMLARCLAQTPKILLLDEPTNHLDLAARAELINLLRDLPLTIVAVLHDLSFVPDFAPRILLMRDGKIILDGASSEVLLSSELGHAFGLNVRSVQLDDGSTTFVFRPRGA